MGRSNKGIRTAWEIRQEKKRSKRSRKFTSITIFIATIIGLAVAIYMFTDNITAAVGVSGVALVGVYVLYQVAKAAFRSFKRGLINSTKVALAVNALLSVGVGMFLYVTQGATDTTFVTPIFAFMILCIFFMVGRGIVHGITGRGAGYHPHAGPHVSWDSGDDGGNGENGDGNGGNGDGGGNGGDGG